MAILVELSFILFGVGISVSKLLALAVKELSRREVKYEVTPMCTGFEAENVAEAFNVVKVAYWAVFGENVQRVASYVNYWCALQRVKAFHR